MLGTWNFLKKAGGDMVTDSREIRVLHTSDWHIGRMLFGKKRYKEHEAFLKWLVTTIREREVEVLLVAGDIFDTNTPSNRAQQIYYRFLFEVAATGCRHVVVTGGNHDSPTFLNAPRELLRALNIYVVGSACDDPSEEVLVLRGLDGEPEMVVCAVPYLRDRDVRQAEAGEDSATKQQRLLNGIREHYEAVAQVAETRVTEAGRRVPVVAMGHLFTEGGEVTEGDGVRELYIGSLAQVAPGSFPAVFDYVALGHLHRAQEVKEVAARYSGAPLAMGFGEANRKKSVTLLTFANEAATPGVELVEVPVYQRLARVAGGWESISRQLSELCRSGQSVWLDVVYNGSELMGDLRERLEETVTGSALEILRITNTRATREMLALSAVDETLDILKVDDVFERCLNANQVLDDQREELINTYREAVVSLEEDDIRAE